MADWSLLPKDILELIVGRFETSFQIVHIRSVCSSWRFSVPLTGDSRCLGIKTHVNGLPRFEGDESFTLKKIPVFLLRFQTPFGSDYVLAEIREGKSGEPMLMSSPISFYGIAHGTLQDNKATSDDISGRTGQLLLNSLTSQIIPLGHHYEMKYDKMVGLSFRTRLIWEKRSMRAEFLELDNSKDGRDFVVLANAEKALIMFRSRNMSWTNILNHPKFNHHCHSYQDMVSFKGKFYAVESRGWGQVFVIEPSLEVTDIPSVRGSHKSFKERLVKSGEDLLLVQRFTPGKANDEHMYTWFRVFKLDGEGSGKKWVEINDLNDRVIFLGKLNICLSVQKLPSAKENCIVFIESKEGISYRNDSILVFDLRTRRTSKAFTECRGYMGAFGENLESMVSCGLVTLPNPMILESEPE